MPNNTIALQLANQIELAPPITTKEAPNRLRSFTAKRILIVDDEPNLAFILQRVLSSLPNTIAFSTQNPHEALSASEKECFDIVITDYQMPEMDGLTLAKHIHYLHPQSKIIMLTAHDHIQLLHHSGDSPLHTVITKPISPHTLRKFVLDLLVL